MCPLVVCQLASASHHSIFRYQQVRTPFVWRDRVSATSVIVDIHPGGYGGEIPLLDPSDNESTSSYFSRDGLLCDCVGIPSLPDVMCYAFRGDNYGPAGVNETEENWKVFGKAFPNAVVKASTFDAFFDLLNQPAVRDQLPVVTSEIGDTWIYGVRYVRDSAVWSFCSLSPSDLCRLPNFS